MIHREGRALLFVMLVLLFCVNLAVYTYLPEYTAWQQGVTGISIVVYILVLQFFRNPPVQVDANDRYVLAPADGKVVVIEETDEVEYLKERRIQVSVFMSPINVHVNRMPVSGQISYFKYHPGKYLVAWHPKSSTENERTSIAVSMGNGTKIMFRQIAGALARRIKCYVHEGQTLKQGEEFGFIKFGSRVDLFLPLNAKIRVGINEKTKAGKTIIAELP